MNSGIYKISFLSCWKVYIGSTVNFKKRKNSHLHDLRADKHPNRHLQNAFKLYGENKFVFEEILLCDPKDLLQEEEKYIQIFDSYHNGYNLVEKPTKNNLGLLHTNQSKQKMSNSAKKRGRNAGLQTHIVNLIREDFFNGQRVGEISKKFKLSKNVITRIVQLQTYKDIPVKIEGYDDLIKQKMIDYKNKKRPFSRGWKHSVEFIEKLKKVGSKPKKNLRKLTDQQIHEIRIKSASGATCKQLSIEYRVNQNTISRIVRKLIYKDI